MTEKHSRHRLVYFGCALGVVSLFVVFWCRDLTTAESRMKVGAGKMNLTIWTHYNTSYVTFDRYLGQQSIKSSTRTKQTAKRETKQETHSEVLLPQVWAQFISLEQNKVDFATYLSAELYKYVLKRVFFGSKECTIELRLECAYFLGQTS